MQGRIKGSCPFTGCPVGWEGESSSHQFILTFSPGGPGEPGFPWGPGGP